MACEPCEEGGSVITPWMIIATLAGIALIVSASTNGRNEKVRLQLEHAARKPPPGPDDEFKKGWNAAINKAAEVSKSTRCNHYDCCRAATNAVVGLHRG